MADSAAFDLVCGKLEEATPLERLAARGTVRIALKEAGLDARTVTAHQMGVVVSSILVRELGSRGVGDAQALCAALRRELDAIEDAGSADSPEAIFERLGG